MAEVSLFRLTVNTLEVGRGWQKWGYFTQSKSAFVDYQRFKGWQRLAEVGRGWQRLAISLDTGARVCYFSHMPRYTPLTSFSLPLPDKCLRGNAKGHWAIVARAVGKSRGRATLTTVDFLPDDFESMVCKLRQLSYFVIYYYENNMPDRDNITKSLKSVQDGIADALLLDDVRFNCLRVFRFKCPRGHVPHVRFLFVKRKQLI